MNDDLDKLLHAARSAPRRPDPATLAPGFETRLAARMHEQAAPALPSLRWVLPACGASMAFCGACFFLLQAAYTQAAASWVLDSWTSLL